MKKISREEFLIGYANEYRHWLEIAVELKEKRHGNLGHFLGDSSVSCFEVSAEQRKRRLASGQCFYIVDDHEFFEITASEAGAHEKKLELARNESQPGT